MKKELICFFILILFSFPIISAATYYVDFDFGNDNNPGTENAPWKNCPGMRGWIGTAQLQPGDIVYFKNTGIWLGSSGYYLLDLKGGVTYDGRGWGDGERATLKATSDMESGARLVRLLEDHPTIPTIFRGFDVDSNFLRISGISINMPTYGNLTGATKRIEDCVIHDFAPTGGCCIYGLTVSSGGYNRPNVYHVENVELIDNVVYGSSWSAISLYPANDNPGHTLKNVLVRGNEVYNTRYGIGVKNHVINATIENNYVHDTHVHGSGINEENNEEMIGAKGPENIIFRNNIYENNPRAISIWGSSNKSLDIYGNIFYNNSGETEIWIELQDRLPYNAAGILSLRFYNNVFVSFNKQDWSQQIRVIRREGTIERLEFVNNIFYSIGGTNNHRLILEDGSINFHRNNLFYKEVGGHWVMSGGSNYNGDNLLNWESTAIVGEPLFNDIYNPPTGFIGNYGIDLRPNTEGLSLPSNSPAIDGGFDLGSSYSMSINSISRPQGYAWDIGAYEYVSGEIIPDPPTPPITPTSEIVTLQDMLGAYQQYKRNEVSLIYFLDKLRRWIVFW